MVTLTSQTVKKIMKRSRSSNKTHFYANKKHIDEIGDDVHANILEVTVVYLHCNSLTSVKKLSLLTNLTHLYLQWNKITSLEDLHDLPNLTNLYLGHNCIDFLDGLNRVPKLKVLHVQSQKLSMNVINFSFKTQILTELSQSLTELNVSGNYITSITELQLLNGLIHLDVSNNLISDVIDVCSTVRKLKNLQSLEIEKNPITSNKKYKCDIIASSRELVKINGKDISTTSRIFMQALKTVKLQQERRKQNNKKMGVSLETRGFVHQLAPEFRDIVLGSAIQNTQ